MNFVAVVWASYRPGYALPCAPPTDENHPPSRWLNKTDHLCRPASCVDQRDYQELSSVHYEKCQFDVASIGATTCIAAYPIPGLQKARSMRASIPASPVHRWGFHVCS